MAVPLPWGPGRQHAYRTLSIFVWELARGFCRPASRGPSYVWEDERCSGKLWWVTLAAPGTGTQLGVGKGLVGPCTVL